MSPGAHARSANSRALCALASRLALLGAAAFAAAAAPAPSPAAADPVPRPAARAAAVSKPAAAVVAPAAPRVESFSPRGTVRDVRSVTARFSAPMVALGDPRLADPFTVECGVPGSGRWADGRNWVYDFVEDLPAGMRCTFRLRSGAAALDGRAIGGASEFTFDTGGPKIRRSFPFEGASDVDEQQVFLLGLDAPATPESVAANARCVVDGLAEQVPVEVLGGEARAAVLAQRKAFRYAWYQLLWKDGERTAARLAGPDVAKAEERIVALRCRRTLPPETGVRLVWGPGIAAPGGIATRTAQSLAFRVRPAFDVRVECARSNPAAGCLPMQPVRVVFSAPVPRSLALGVRVRAPGGAERAPTAGEAKDAALLDQVIFAAPLEPGQPLVVSLPPDLRDDAGRAPGNAARFPLEIRVDDYPPLVKFAADFGILEAKQGGVLPVTLRNVELKPGTAGAAIPGRQLHVDPKDAARWLRRVEKANANDGEFVLDERTGRQAWREKTGEKSVFDAGDAPAAFAIERPQGLRQVEVVGIPLRAPGLYVVELESRRLGAALLGRDQPRYVSSAALVTNLAVHFKWGREASRAWVTTLDGGQPVADALVSVESFCRPGPPLWEGRTARDGTARIDAALGAPHQNDSCEYGPAPLIVRVQKGDDFSFALSSWTRGIGPADFGLPLGGEWDLDIVHTVLDRPLLRAGETVSMKHFARRHRSTGFTVPASLTGRRKVIVAHVGSDQRWETFAEFDAGGVAEQQWAIPREAKLGDYVVSVVDAKGATHRAARFKVEEFRLPTMRATVQGPATPLVRPTAVSLDLHVAYLSGGSASGLPVKVRTVVERSPLRFPGYDEFEFGGAPVVEGLQRTEGGDFDYDPESGEGEDAGAPPTAAQVVPLTLDAQGAARIAVPVSKPVDEPHLLTAELEYADANGETQTTVRRVRLLPSVLAVGIRREGWAATATQLRFRVVVLGADGKPAAGQPVTVSTYASDAYSYRKRLIGGFYTYETVRETKRLAPKCAGTTDAQGLVTCEIAPGVSGEVKLRAEVRDRAGNAAGATVSVWVAGQDDWWFGGTSGDRMDLLPEKKEYEPGDRARFQVRMPFRAATALVTVEREGVVDSYVTRLSGRSPVIEVPVGDSYAPNVYVSVLAVRGRVPRSEARAARQVDADVTALVDLAKPAFRLGMAEINVGWKPYRLDVRVTPDRSTYRARDKAEVTIRVARASGTPLPAGTEVALAAVDSALLDLAPNPSWALLDAMMGRRASEVLTATAQMQVVGKRHYGRKAVPHGGGGGRDRARELFDTLLAWKGRVVLDANGEARVAMALNDSLSEFRIVAVAHSGAELFGTGSTTIATTQELVLLSGLPPLVREGDRFAATFTVRNTTKEALTVAVAPALDAAAALPPRQFPLAPGEARDVQWPVTVPAGASQLSWDVTARALPAASPASADAASAVPAPNAARDRLRVTQRVMPAVPVRTHQATLVQLDGSQKLPIAPPRDALPGRGALEVSLAPSLAGSLDGVREYMRGYPYTCIEQELSRAVALRDAAAWRRSVERLPAYLDRDGLVRYFPTEAMPGEDVLTAYVLALADEAGYAIPDEPRQRMIDALQRFVAGRLVRRSALPTADLAIRRLAAIEALSRYEAATARMLDSIPVEPDLWPTSAVLDWLNVLERVPGIARADERTRAAEQVLRSRLNFQGTTLGFSTERTDALWWLMIGGDSNANRAVLTVLARAAWREDVSRLVRGALARQQRGRWNTTVANAWGVLALEKFSKAFESVPVTGSTSVAYGAGRASVMWPRQDSRPTRLPWVAAPATLDVSHAGTGKPWLLVRATAAVPLREPLSTGFRVQRSIAPVEQRVAGRWSRGDVARVKLQVEAQADATWVVVDDPIPGGASILGSGLGGQSQLVQRGATREGWAWSAFEERRFEGFRAYFRYVPKGTWTVEYTVRLNNPGTFVLPPTRVEAMYAPEMLGELPNTAVTVDAAP